MLFGLLFIGAFSASEQAMFSFRPSTHPSAMLHSHVSVMESPARMNARSWIFHVGEPVALFAA